MKTTIKLYLSICIIFISCGPKIPAIQPDIITDRTNHDTDDPAIWVNKQNPSESIVFGTDKETDGAIYAFDLNGKIIESKTIRDLERPNNVDVEYNVNIGNKRADILVFTEREKQQVRIFTVPEMEPIDNGGFKVFTEYEEDEMNLPMGIAIYKSPETNKSYVIISRKNGPQQDYLHQHEIVGSGNGIEFPLVREFGTFSGKKEIEAIAVDSELGFIYYSDEGHCIRKYYADPSKGDEEISCFGSKYFRSDIEGIAIAKNSDDDGYIIVSDQQRGTFNFFSRKTNVFKFAQNLGTEETDGCEVYVGYLGDRFPNGLFVAMNDDKNFYFYDYSKISGTTNSQ